MHPIIYDVAVSLDGFICGPQADISKFDFEGPVVDDYHLRMDGYETAIMGRLTYEFGYQFGLIACLLYTSPSPRDKRQYRMPSSA